ncbi:MAG TPA: helix-turn-helix domain-containing protein [Candidatus Limnocylindrales bacterium]|nr:helix-turn-helix domain-containing protein [Candidatus Limnocylindrales bacterium]
MSAATDTFVAFVDVLTDALDDHETTGDALAARLCLSRFHFDRVIASVAGEPPATFRRRIMLERAAYRLVTTDRTVLDVAVEAGYGSHEAFTRAFARAYGTRPTQWRRRPTQTQIAAPSDVHFSPPGGLRLPARSKEAPMNLLVKIVEHHVWLTGEMVERAARLPDDVLDKPIMLSVEGVDDDPTLRKLLSRLVGQLAMWNAVLAMRDYDWSVEQLETVDSMRRRLALEGPTFLRHVRTVSEDGRLDETFVDALCQPAEVFTHGGMIAHVLTFAAHRRTLVCGALIDAGIDDLGAGDPRLWVAEAA